MGQGCYTDSPVSCFHIEQYETITNIKFFKIILLWYILETERQLLLW